MNLRERLSHYWNKIQGNLFPELEENLGTLTSMHQKIVTALEVLRIEEYVLSKSFFEVGRREKSRESIARSFVAKAVLGLSQTRDLLERLNVDPILRKICGSETRKEIPSESTFSRAFQSFAKNKLGERVHKSLIEETQKDNLVGHISRDSTAIKAREKAEKKSSVKLSKKKRGRRKKGEKESHEEPALKRMDKQMDMSVAEMLSELPTNCDVGIKRNSEGFQNKWKGYKLHIDVADGHIPISCILTSASVHDSQVAIPLAKMTATRVTNLYDLMDAAYDAKQIREMSLRLGHIPLIDRNTRRDTKTRDELASEAKRQKLIHMPTPEAIRYNARSASERVNSRMKDEFGADKIYVKGHAKIMCHLMFGILALTVDQLMKFVS